MEILLGLGLWSLNTALLYCMTETGLKINIWHLLASLSLNNKMLGVVFLHGELCKCLSSVCFPPICLSVCCLLVTVGLAAQQSASSQTFADHVSMTIHIIYSSLPLQPLPVWSLLCGATKKKKVSLFLELLWEFCPVFTHHLHNTATSTPSLPAGSTHLLSHLLD